jgi:hypothetical protein
MMMIIMNSKLLQFEQRNAGSPNVKKPEPRITKQKSTITGDQDTQFNPFDNTEGRCCSVPFGKHGIPDIWSLSVEFRIKQQGTENQN